MDAPQSPGRRVPRDPGGFARVPNKDLQDGEITAQALRVRGALDHFLDKDSGVCDPSTTAIANYLGLSARWVKAMVTLLEARGSIVVDRASGRRNRYLAALGPKGKYALQRRATGEVGFTGSPTSPVSCTSPVEQFTGEVQLTGTGEVGFTGSQNPPIRDLRMGKEGEEIPLPVCADTSKPEPHLFAAQHRHWLRTGLEYVVEGKAPAWLVSAVAEFFVRRCWCNRARDDDGRWGEVHNAHVWVRDLVEAGASEPETAEAMRWVDENPMDNRHNRDDLRRRVLGRIRDRRRTAARTVPALVDVAAEERAAWAAAGEDERESAREVVRRFGKVIEGGKSFQAACEHVLLQERRRGQSEMRL